MITTDGIILDIDGTLWDTTDICAISWNTIIKEHSNLPPCVTGDQLKGLFGKPMDEIFQAIFPGITPEETDRLGRLCESFENEYLVDHPGMIYPGVVETLQKLSKDIPLFIVSNCQKGYIEVCMEALGITSIIQDFESFGNSPLTKGENITLVCERNGLKQAVYVGDTRGDELSSEMAGVPFIFASYGFGKCEHPAATISRMEDLLSIVKRP